MIEQVLAELKNYFIYDSEWAYRAETDGIISRDADVYMKNQHIFIVGSVLNDGVYKVADIDGNKLVTEEELQEEDGRGFVVYALAVPKEVQNLAQEIDEYVQKTTAGMQSESLGDYSYTRGTTPSGRSDWTTAFADRLSPWRKFYLHLPHKKAGLWNLRGRF